MSKEKDKKRRLRQQKWEKEKAQIDDMRRKAPELKMALRKVGCNLPFYDYLDSYTDEFARIVAWAKTQFPTLLDVYEVEEADFQQTDWTKFGSSNDRQVFFDIEDRFSTYGTASNPNANMKGCVTYFRDGESRFKTVVLILRNPKTTSQHKELKYALKIGALLHELGHVHDAEHCTNIDPITRRFDVIEAEAYANCYALEQLAERCLFYTYAMIYEAMQTLAAAGGYEADVGRLVIERHERRQIPHWQDFLDVAMQASGAGS